MGTHLFGSPCILWKSLLCGRFVIRVIVTEEYKKKENVSNYGSKHFGSALMNFSDKMKPIISFDQLLNCRPNVFTSTKCTVVFFRFSC